MITPLVSPRCTTGACHGGSVEPNLSSFMTLAAKYKMKPGTGNILVTKAAAGTMHYTAVFFSDAEKLTVGNWIDSLP